MSTKRLAIDGLWHCLCPSFGTAALNRLSDLHTNGKLLRAAKSSLQSSTSRYSTTASTVQIPIRKTFAPPPKTQLNAHLTPERLQELDLKDVLSARNRARQRPGPQQERWREYLAKKQRAKEQHHLVAEDFSKVSTEDLHIRLEDAARRGRLEFVRILIRHLVEVRGEVPALLHYHALIRSNTHAQLGSASAVKILLDEMKEKSIMADSTLYRHALKVSSLSWRKDLADILDLGSASRLSPPDSNSRRYANEVVQLNGRLIS
jgi:hypothetical protein